MELLPEVSVVLASVFTSASLDAFCAGLPVINYLDPNNFNFSPLRGHPNARFVSSAEEILRFSMTNSGFPLLLERSPQISFG